MTPAAAEPQVLHELLIRCAHGDQEAFAEHYRLTSPFVYAVVSRRLGSASEAETVLVQIYVTLWRTASAYDKGGDTSGWTWTLAVMDQTLAERTVRLGRRSRVSHG